MICILDGEVIAVCDGKRSKLAQEEESNWQLGQLRIRESIRIGICQKGTNLFAGNFSGSRFSSLNLGSLKSFCLVELYKQKADESQSFQCVLTLFAKWYCRLVLTVLPSVYSFYSTNAESILPNLPRNSFYLRTLKQRRIMTLKALSF